MNDASKKPAVPPSVSITIDLGNPWLAGILAWLWPGAGHLYQRRYGKGLLFMVCILSIFFFGLVLGQGRVVYAMNPTNQDPPAGGGIGGIFTKFASLAPLPFWLQAGTGLPAMPAVLQRMRVKSHKPPLFNGWMAPPNSAQELNSWHRQLNQRFDMGVLYTMIAGLLNFFAIWDAAAGPAPSEPADKKKKDKSDPKKDDPPKSSPSPAIKSL
ncbi:DUF6677 family protein [Anatilimnocola floriformis]|uniref:DUF6677 family protein n=1 Tax=Anatilimnocola floriformis TaxID=2948575 RepID=UPI0020C43214|nr:DUF6677 family protein [Anatilimnocola floriformis]